MEMMVVVVVVIVVEVIGVCLDVVVPSANKTTPNTAGDRRGGKKRKHEEKEKNKQPPKAGSKNLGAQLEDFGSREFSLAKDRELLLMGLERRYFFVLFLSLFIFTSLRKEEYYKEN